jgi:hypothetical protein
MAEEDRDPNNNTPDADELRGADALTYKIRLANLCNMLAHGLGILQTPRVSRKRNKIRIRNKKITVHDKRICHSLQLWRGENGMTAHLGYVKNSTKVLFDDTRHHQSFDVHPFFHTIPYACIRETLGKHPFFELRCLEKEIQEILQASTKMKYTSHKYGANEGVNCGMSFSGGGTLSNKDSGVSGTVQWSAFIKGKPDLRKRLCDLFRIILQDAFGDCLWYKGLLVMNRSTRD